MTSCCIRPMVEVVASEIRTIKVMTKKRIIEEYNKYKKASENLRVGENMKSD